MRRVWVFIFLGSCVVPDKASWAPEVPVLPGEKHFRWIRQLTSDGTHAEAYFSPDGRKLILMGLREGDPADQIYSLDLETGRMTRLSTGKGKCTCGYYLPDGRFIYSSTHHHGSDPPPPPDRSHGYVWPLYRTFDLFLDEGNGKLTQLTDNDGYDAETTPSPDGKRIVFTSHREEAISLYTMAVDGTDLRKVTQRRGYAGGAFFSPDGEWLVYRAFYPRSPEEHAEFERMLTERALRPTIHLEIYVSRPDGSEERQLTSAGKVNFAPVFFPDGRRVLYSSELPETSRRKYGLFMVKLKGGEPERITRHDGYDLFPHFSPDGRHLVWISNRNATKDPKRELNVFLAEWVD